MLKKRKRERKGERKIAETEGDQTDADRGLMENI